MKKQMPVILLSIICIALAIMLYNAKHEYARLSMELAESKEAVARLKGMVGSSDAVTSDSAAEASGGITNQPLATLVQAKPEEAGETSQRRIMSNMAKMIEENPTINKMVEASQRGAIGALYSDMIEYLNLNAEETKYFMDLLMYRQMANVDVHLKMMSGNLTEEEKQALMEKVKLANETTRDEMEKFLNDSEDFTEFKFYEDTIGERMMLSQMDQKLGEAALSDETYREVLKIMHDERENFDFSTDLHDNENRDLSPERFSQENIQKHLADMKALGEQMDQSLQDILTPGQLEAWRQSGEAMMQLQAGQLHQASQMFNNE